MEEEEGWGRGGCTVVKVRRKYRCTPVWCETKPVYAGNFTDIGIPTITGIKCIILVILPLPTGTITGSYIFLNAI